LSAFATAAVFVLVPACSAEEPQPPPSQVEESGTLSDRDDRDDPDDRDDRDDRDDQGR